MEFDKENSVVRVSFTGGIIGILAGSHRGRLEKAILAKNRDRWNLAEVIPDNPNLIIWIFRLAILVLTLGLWTLSTGYILVFERPVIDGKGHGAIHDGKRREPMLTAQRNTV
jgi:hypothetical protein